MRKLNTLQLIWSIRIHVNRVKRAILIDVQSLLILGRQPELGLAELESLYGTNSLQVIHSHAVIVDVDPCTLAFERLGGSKKFCKILTTLNTASWHDIEEFLKNTAPRHAQTMPEGKMRLGFSIVGFSLSLGQLQASGLSLKKAIQKTGRSVRLIPNKEMELSTAQVIHNQLTGPTGWELVFIRDGSQTIIAQTVKVQNIAAYTRRDRERPKRDSRVGMLPPKLAQIIINLAVGKLPLDLQVSKCDIPENNHQPSAHIEKTILDPFCGSGVILQESLLDGYGIYGTDIEPRMVDYTRTNLEWLDGVFQLQPQAYSLDVGDATTYAWTRSFDFVATETYLGRPFTAFPSPEILAQTVTDCNLILKRFLKHIYEQISVDTRLCLAVPAWQIRPDQFKRLPLIDQIADLGYNQLSFEHIRSGPLIYYRSKQIVARELIVLTRR